jgi:hypothetical protein
MKTSAKDIEWLRGKIQNLDDPVERELAANVCDDLEAFALRRSAEVAPREAAEALAMDLLEARANHDFTAALLIVYPDGATEATLTAPAGRARMLWALSDLLGREDKRCCRLADEADDETLGPRIVSSRTREEAKHVREEDVDLH